MALFFSCEHSSIMPAPQTFFAGNAMTIDYRIIIGADLTNDQEQQVEQAITNVFKEVNAIYNKWNPDSEISKLNGLSSYQTVVLSHQLHSFLNNVSTIVTLTDGLFDPTIESLQQLWINKLQLGLKPTTEEIAALAAAIGWQKIHFENGLFYKEHEATSLDLGGIAKGYCVDLLTERLQKLGFSNIYVEWGGEIRTTGRHPSGRTWAVLIRSPTSNDPFHTNTRLDLQDQAVATSGDYLQNWTIEEKGQKETYFHIIHPHMNHPLKITATSVASATIAAPTCMLADGLATAALMFPSAAECETWLRSVQTQMPEIDFWLISRKEIGSQEE